MNYEERLANLRRHIDGGTLVREEWGNGYERAGLLAALAPETAEARDSCACPAEVMPLWLAHLVPWMNDFGTLEAWPQMVERFYRVATRWQVLDDAAWERARIGSLIGIVSHARKSCPEDAVEALAAIGGVFDWLRRGAPEDEREKVRSVVAAAKSADAAAAEWASAKSAEWESESAAARLEAAAERAAVDDLTFGILAAIEEECTKKENLP